MKRQLFGNCDLLLFDHLGLARVQSFVPSSIRRPYAVFLHSIEAWEPLEGSRMRALRDAKIRVANSYFTAARVAAANPGIGPIEVCHLALEPNSVDRGPNPSDSTANSETQIVNQIRANSVLIVGRMLAIERHKGHEQLIRAWSLVKQSIPDAQLVVVGRGDDAPRLKQLAEQVGIGDCVLFTGPVSDRTLETIYDRVAVFAMPSGGEGFGIVYLEAMAHRLACVASVHDAAREIIVEGETGFLVEQVDIANLASKLTHLLGDAALRHRLGCSGFERLRAQFSFEAFQSRISHLLERLNG
jgi:phosphatidylinositol alpha-1,6-mannosyltransferase